MLAMFSLPFSYGGFACGPFKTDHKIEFNDRAQAISGMPYAVCDAYQEAARFDLEYNGELGHSSRRGRIHDEKRNTGLIAMGIEVATVNNEMLCDMEAMEALAWRIHQRMGKLSSSPKILDFAVTEFVTVLIFAIFWPEHISNPLFQSIVRQV